jgi:histidinol-phosphatase
VSYDRELAAAQRWLDEADRTALKYFGDPVLAEVKTDGTPVTIADRAIEETLRRSIEKEFSGDDVLGEEGGATGTGSRRWIIDPIDATKNYVRGIPIFGTLLALEHDGELVVGLASAPALGQRWWATGGGGAFRDGRRISVSDRVALAEAEVTTGSLSYADAGTDEAVLALCRRASRSRAFGDFWGHVLVAQGSMDVMVEFAPLAAWDVAAPKLIVTEAGGRMTNLEGSDAAEGSCLSTNGHLHDEVLALLQEK